MTGTLALALPFFGLIAVGYAAGWIWRGDREDDFGWLNIFVLYFAVPALFFRLVSRAPVEQLTEWRFILATGLATYAAFAIAFAYAAVRNGGDLPEATIQGLIGGYGNVGYMGPPLALAALGPTAAVPAAMIFCVDVALVMTLASLMTAVAGVDSARRGRTLLLIPVKVVTHPFVLATVIAVLVAIAELQPPALIDQLLAMLGNAAAPCALFAIGVTVSRQTLKRVPGELPVLIMVKLVAHPFLVYLILTWVGGFDLVWISTGVLMASLPPAATIFVLATQHDVYIFRASSAILIGTAVSVVTVTAVLFLVTGGHLPMQPFGR